MKQKLLKSGLFLALSIMTISTGYSGYQIQPENPSASISNVDENKEDQKELHKVTFQNRQTNETSTRYFPDGYILSMADLADATSGDKNAMYVAGDQYLTWSVTEGESVGQSLSNHIPVTGNMILEGLATSYMTTNNIRLSYSNNEGFKNRSYETATVNTLQATYQESLNPGSEFVGQPDNIIFLTEKAYNHDVSLELQAVSAEKDGGPFFGISLRSFKNGKYQSVTHVEQSQNSGFAIGQAVNIRLSSSSGSQNGYGSNDSTSQKKFVSYNADDTIGLSNPEANAKEGGDSKLQTPYKDLTSSGTYTYNPTTNSYSANYCANRIVLESDVIFSGNITIGGITGYFGKNIDFSQSGFQGYINGSYCEIDLNGYDLILPSEHSLTSYGSITDSSRFNIDDKNTFSNETDKGSLVMLPGSTLQTPFVLEDIFLPLSAPMSFYNANAPFNFYRCPYLDCETVFYSGSRFQAEYKVDLAGWSDEKMGVQGIVQLIGSSSNSSGNELLLLNSGKIIRNVTYNDQFKSFASNLFNQQINYSVENADLIFSNWLINFQVSSVSMGFDSRRAQFFIPFYYQIEIKNSKVHLSTELVFMAGSHLEIDCHSTLLLSYSSVLQTASNSYFDPQSYQSVGGLTFLDTFYYSPTSKSYYPLPDAKNGDLLESNASLWKVLSDTPAYCNFDGQILLQENEGIQQNHPFVFGGQMDISSMESFQTEIDHWNQTASHKKVRLFGNYFMLGPNSSQSKNAPGSINYFYVRGFYTPPLMTRKNEVLVDYTTTDHVVRDDVLPGSSSGTSFIDGLPTGIYDSKTGLITDGDNTYAFIPDYSWSANWDNDNTSNFYGATTLATTKRNPDDLAGSFWKVTSHGNYISVAGQDYGRYVLEKDWLGREKMSSQLTFDRPYNIFYRGSFVLADSVSGNAATTYLYRYAGGKTGDARGQSYTMSYANNTWSIKGKA